VPPTDRSYTPAASGRISAIAIIAVIASFERTLLRFVIVRNVLGSMIPNRITMPIQTPRPLQAST
jgi:hypothetical protein